MTTFNRIFKLGKKIEAGTATPQEALEWLDLNDNGNEIRQKAVEILKEALTSPTPLDPATLKDAEEEK